MKCLFPVTLPILAALLSLREPCLVTLRPVSKGSLYLDEAVPGFFKGVATPGTGRTAPCDVIGFGARFCIVCFRSFLR